MKWQQVPMPATIGMTRERMMIDWEKYKDVECRTVAETYQEREKREVFYKKGWANMVVSLNNIKNNME